MKILGLTTFFDDKDKKYLSAVDWWRVVNPLTQLKKHYDVTILDTEPDWEEVGKNYDVVLTSYVLTKQTFAYLRALHEKYGTIHIMDIDDDLFDIDAMNPSRLRYFNNSDAKLSTEIMVKDVDVLTCSTPYLQSKLMAMRGKDVFIMPNRIDPTIYEFTLKDKHEGIMIGYQGSSTHYTDIFKTGYIWALRRILNDYPQTTVGLIGWYDELKDYLPYDRVKYLDGSRDFWGWVKRWKRLEFDIATAPLIHSPFNMGKSSIKYFEYGLNKLPGVYEKWTPYESVVKENKTGFLVQTEDEWYTRLADLIEHPEKRKQMGEAAHTDVSENHNAEILADLWKELIEYVA